MRAFNLALACIALVMVFVAPAHAVITNADIAAWYRLDGDAMDSSGNGAHGVNSGAAFVADGVRGTVASFNGTSSSINVSSSGFSVTEHPNLGFSTAFWIKPTARQDFNPGGAIDVNPLMGGTGPTRGVVEIVGHGSWGGMGGSSAYGGVGVNSGGGAGSTGKLAAVDLYDGNWHHVLIQWEDPDGSIAGNTGADAQVFIDGTPALDANGGTYNGNNGNTNPAQFVLGGPVVFSNGGGQNKYYNGLMSDVLFFNRQLTAQEAIEAMAYPAAAPPPPPVPFNYDTEVLMDNPVVYYRFDEAPGAPMAIDSSGNGNDGTYLGGVTLGGPGATPHLSGAAEFDGSSGWVDVPALAPGGLAQSTVEFWVNADALAGGCCTSIFSTDTFGGGNLHFNLKGGLDIEHAIAGGGPNNANTPDGAISFDEWAHVVATYDTLNGGEVLFYVNGQLLATSAHNNANMMTLVDAAIGAWNQNGSNVQRFFNGELDEFAIYDSILAPERIEAHYLARDGATAGIPEPATATLALLGLLGLAGRHRRCHA